MQKRSQHVKRLVLAALRGHGPMSDGQLAWWLGRFHIPAKSAAAARRRLVQRGEVRWAHRVCKNPRGQLTAVWEAVR
jgi:hypothetical protein